MSAFGVRADITQMSFVTEISFSKILADRIPCSRAKIPCSAKIIPCSVEQGIGLGCLVTKPLFAVSDRYRNCRLCKIPCSFPCYQGIWRWRRVRLGLRPPPNIL
jgi:hypothetical protein